MKRKTMPALVFFLSLTLSFIFIMDSISLAAPNSKNTGASLLTANISGGNHVLLAAADEVQAAQMEGIVLSHNNFFYSESINVKISFEMAGVSSYAIYYTDDGTEPSKSKTLYSNPVKISMPISKVITYCLKVKVFYESGGKKYETPTMTHTYFIGQDVNKRFDSLVFSITTDPDNLDNYERGIFVEGKLRDDYIKANPGKNIDPPAPANYNVKGLAGERPIYLEVFESNGTRVISQGAGMRVHGGWSRANRQKSLTLLAKKVYEPVQNLGKFQYTFFEGAVFWDGKTSVEDVTNVAETNNAVFDRYERILLRNSANDFCFAYQRNEVSAMLATEAGLPNATRFRPAAVFVNGEYYGYAWLEDIYGEQYLQQYFNAPDDNFAIMDFGENTEKSSWYGVDEGPDSAYNDFKAVYDLVRKGLTDDASYKKFCSLVDIDNLILYYAIQCYIDNRDWPRGNMKIWRYYGESDGSNQYLDGKWRFLFYDNEFAWGLYDSPASKNTLKRLLGTGDTNDGGMSYMLKELMKRKDFQKKFINCLCDLANDSLSTKNVAAAVDYISGIQKNELDYAMKNLSDYHSWDGGLDKNRNDIKNFARQRYNIIYKQMSDLYNYDATYTITVKGAEGMNVRFSTINIEGDETKTSVYFSANSVLLNAYESTNNYKFSHWLINGEIVQSKIVELNAGMCKFNKIQVELIADKQVISPLLISEVYIGSNAGYVKIMNTSNESVTTAGLYLSDDTAKPTRWKFPTITVEPGMEITLVNKSNTSSSALMNTALSFSVKGDELLYMSDDQGRVLSCIRVPKLGDGKMLKLNLKDNLYYTVAKLSGK